MSLTSAHFTAVGIALLVVITATLLLQERRMPQSTLAWLLAIMVVPYLAAPLFLLLGARKMGRRRPHVPHENAAVAQDAATTFRALGAARPREGNHLHLVDSPQRAWAELVALIEGARHSLDATYYIVSNDAEGQEFLRLLAAKAAQGVRVRLTLDRLGSFFPPWTQLRQLRRAGGELRWHAPLINRWTRGGLNLRDHRKVLIADGLRLMTGGMNVGGDYMRMSGPEGAPAAPIAGAESAGIVMRTRSGSDPVEDGQSGADQSARCLTAATRPAASSGSEMQAKQDQVGGGEAANDESAGKPMVQAETVPRRGPAARSYRRPPFDDLNLCLEGPAVQDYRRLFEADWHAAGRTRLWHRPPPEAAASMPELPRAGAARVQLVASGPDRPLDALHKGLVATIHRADRRVWLATPYFLPSGELVLALAVAARRGLDVRLMVPARSNHSIADLAGGSALRFLHGEGCRVLRAAGMVHAKCGLIDDMGWVGTANLDLRSLLLNFETALMLHDPASVALLEGWFQPRFAASTEGVSEVTLLRRLGEGVFRLGAPLL